MSTPSNTSHNTRSDDDLSTPISFYIFMGLLAAALLGALWAVIQMTYM